MIKLSPVSIYNKDIWIRTDTSPRQGSKEHSSLTFSQSEGAVLLELPEPWLSGTQWQPCRPFLPHVCIVVRLRRTHYSSSLSPPFSLKFIRTWVNDKAMWVVITHWDMDYQVSSWRTAFSWFVKHVKQFYICSLRFWNQSHNYVFSTAYKQATEITIYVNVHSQVVTHKCGQKYVRMFVRSRA